MAVPDKRPVRDEDLMMLSGLGQIATNLPRALKYADRARYVELDKATPSLKKLKLRKLEIHGPPPPWIGELTELRTLQCVPGKTLPASLFALPKLRFLHIDGSKIASLDGIERLPALETVTFSRTPLATDEAIAALVAKTGATRTMFIAGLDFDRTAPAAPKQRKKLLAALRDGSLPDESDLRGVDLAGETFEDLLVTHDLRGAKLANTTWLRCDFEVRGKLSRADLTGATFYDCYFASDFSDDGNLRGAKAAGATWIGCGGNLELGGADLRGAKLLDLDPDVALDLTGAKAQGLTLEASFCSEKEHQIEAARADLRGARVFFDITADRRAELSKKKTARLAWKQTHLRGAKTDKTTQIAYAPLDAKSAANPTRAAEPTVDPAGAAAEILGHIAASNASLWCIVADADVAAGWRGSVDEDDPTDDFQRALEADDGPIAIGHGKGVLFHVGDRGTSNLYRIAGGFAVLDASTSVDDEREGDRALALRVAQWPVTTKPKAIGKVSCPSGVLALLLPYRDGAFSARQLARAKGGKVVEDEDHDRLLVPMADGPGVYEVAAYPFRPQRGRDDDEDDVGRYGLAYVVTYRDRLPKARR